MANCRSTCLRPLGAISNPQAYDPAFVVGLYCGKLIGPGSNGSSYAIVFILIYSPETQDITSCQKKAPPLWIKELNRGAADQLPASWASQGVNTGLGIGDTYRPLAPGCAGVAKRA